MSQTEAAGILKIGTKRYQSYESDRAEPPIELVARILTTFCIHDPVTFLTGTLVETAEIPVSPFERSFNELDPRSKKAVEVLMGLG